MNKTINLPLSEAKLDYTDSVKLFVSKTELKLDDTTVALLKNDRIVDFDEGKPEKSLFYQRLVKHKEESEKKMREAMVGDDQEKAELPDYHILFFCDRDLPFKTINNIIKTAAKAGYPNFQFLVLEKS